MPFYFVVQKITDFGNLMTWGSNSYGLLMHGDRTARSSPTQVGSESIWRVVSVAGEWFGAAIKTDGTLWTCGYNQAGQLGLGNRINRSSPVQVGSHTNWKDIKAGQAENTHVLALKTDNSLWSWGTGTHGALGHGGSGNPAARSTPTQVGSDLDWNTIFAGTGCSFAIKTDGTLWSWGLNATSGVLGHGDIISRSSPVQVGSDTDWKEVSASKSRQSVTSHVAFIKTDGTLWTCGLNGYGQLGHGDIINRSSPVQVGSDTDWEKIATGINFLTALKTDGTFWSCGRNNDGQLGLGDKTDRSSLVQIGSENTWVDISAGDRLFLLKKSPPSPYYTLWFTGSAINGMSGNNISLAYASSPTQVGSSNRWKTVNIGHTSVFAIEHPEEI